MIQYWPAFKNSTDSSHVVKCSWQDEACYFIKLLKWYFSWKVRIIFHGYVKHLSFGKNLITVYFTTQNRHSLYSGIHSIPNIACGLLVPIW